MAFFKFSAIICALFVLQAQAYPQEVVGVNSAIDTVKKIVTALETVIDKALEGSLTLIDKFADLITDLQNDDQTAKRLIDAIGVYVDKEVDKIREASDETAQAAFKCLDQYKTEWRFGEANAITEFNGCINTEIAEIIAALRSIVLDLQASQKDIKVAADGINKCDGEDELQTLECVANVAKDVLEVAIKIPDSLKDDVKLLVQIIKDNWTTSITCAETTAKDFYTNTIIKVMNEVATCVRQ